MPTLCTTGYKQKPLSVFINQLRAAGVDGVIDVRLRNTSHLLGYAKKDTLAFLLREGFGIGYEHRRELAPTPEILDGFRRDGDWLTYEARFVPLLRERTVQDVGREILSRYDAPCLLCAELKPRHCHRRLVAEYWAEHLPDISIVHL